MASIRRAGRLCSPAAGRRGQKPVEKVSVSAATASRRRQKRAFLGIHCVMHCVLAQRSIAAAGSYIRSYI